MEFVRSAEESARRLVDLMSYGEGRYAIEAERDVLKLCWGDEGFERYRDAIGKVGIEAMRRAGGVHRINVIWNSYCSAQRHVETILGLNWVDFDILSNDLLDERKYLEAAVSLCACLKLMEDKDGIIEAMADGLG